MRDTFFTEKRVKKSDQWMADGILLLFNNESNLP